VTGFRILATDAEGRRGFGVCRTCRHRLADPDRQDPALSTDQEPAGGAAAARPPELESTVRYLDVEDEDALEISEQTEV
jgi:hypothetical protein